MHFGIREHAMGAVVNGLSLSKMRLRLDLPDFQRLRATVDSTERADGGAGDLHLHARLDWGRRRRSDPSADRAARIVARDSHDASADANEVVEAWRVIMLRHEPVALVLTRQPLPTFDRSKWPGRRCAMCWRFPRWRSTGPASRGSEKSSLCLGAMDSSRWCSGARRQHAIVGTL